MRYSTAIQPCIYQVCACLETTERLTMLRELPFTCACPLLSPLTLSTRLGPCGCADVDPALEALLLGSIGSLDGPDSWDCSIGVGYEICGLDIALLALSTLSPSCYTKQSTGNNDAQEGRAVIT